MTTRPPADRDRREFLGAAAALGGGLILGLALPACSRRRPAAPGPGQLNAWLRIAPDDSITVIVDRAEMGQGVYTALPMLLAEELEVPLGVIRVEAAPVGDAYINVLNGGQITGTSNSVQDAWERLRTAGAQARVLLITAAADRWRVDATQCHAADGRVINSRGESLSYGELADAACRLPLPAGVVLKPPQHFKVVGRPLARLDTPSKVDGSAEFGIDVKLPGMLHAALLQSPVLGGSVRSFEAAAAEKMPGVRRVLPVPGGVAVVAEHYWQALKARDALRVQWDPGVNASLDNAAIRALLRKTAAEDRGLSARADGAAAALLDAAQRASGPHGPARRRAAAGGPVRAVYEVPLLAHATMEPVNCTADVRAESCDLYLGTQVPQLAQTAAAAATGLSPSQVKVHTTLLGGGFGRRLDVDFIPAAVLASKAVAAPVKLIWTREDDLAHDTFRPPALEELTAILEGGKPKALRLHIVSPSITARMFPQISDPFDSVVEYAINFPYAVPNLAIDYSRREIGIDVGYMRSVSHAPNCFAIESFMDELAAAAGRDACDFRRDLLAGKPRHLRVLEAAAARAGWGHAPPGRHHGMAFMEGYSTLLTQVAEVSVGDRLQIHKIVCVVDCGRMINPRIVESQIVGGIIFGLSAALWGEVTLVQGVVQQRNFDGYRVLRGHELPDIEVELLQSDGPPGGIGEPAVALVAPAVCNAVFAAVGRRLRSLPIGGQLETRRGSRQPDPLSNPS